MINPKAPIDFADGRPSERENESARLRVQRSKREAVEALRERLNKDADLRDLIQRVDCTFLQKLETPSNRSRALRAWTDRQIRAALNERCPIGRHAGRTLKAIAETDPQDLEPLLDEIRSEEIWLRVLCVIQTRSEEVNNATDA